MPLSTVATHLHRRRFPQSLNHFQQLNRATIQGVPAPGVAHGDRAQLPAGSRGARHCRPATRSTTGGLSRQYIQESGGFVLTLRLRADHHLPGAGGAVRELPRSVDHPGLGADVDRRRADLRRSSGSGRELNIYTEVGLVTLMGLISKHGILIVEFANNLQKRGPLASARRSRWPPASGCGRS